MCWRRIGSCFFEWVEKEKDGGMKEQERYSFQEVYDEIVARVMTLI